MTAHLLASLRRRLCVPSVGLWRSISVSSVGVGVGVGVEPGLSLLWAHRGKKNQPSLLLSTQAEKEDESTTTATTSSKSFSKYHPRPWEDYYQALQQFHKEQGHCNVTQQLNVKTDPALVYFVKKQRRDRDNGSLTEEQIQLLDQLDFDWETRAQKQERVWNQKYQLLVNYKQQNGHCDCPTRYLPNLSLGRWVDRQRRLFKNGHLSQERVDLLNKIGFSWVMVQAPPRDTATHDKKWRRQFLKLVDHANHYGHCV